MEEVPYRLQQIKFAPKTWEIIDAHVERNTFVPAERKPAWREAITLVRQEMEKDFLTIPMSGSPLIICWVLGVRDMWKYLFAG